MTLSAINSRGWSPWVVYQSTAVVVFPVVMQLTFSELAFSLPASHLSLSGLYSAAGIRQGEKWTSILCASAFAGQFICSIPKSVYQMVFMQFKPWQKHFFLLPLPSFSFFCYLLKWIGCRLHLCSFINYKRKKKGKKNRIHQCFISKTKLVINEFNIVLAVPFVVPIYPEYGICFILVHIGIYNILQ